MNPTTMTYEDFEKVVDKSFYNESEMRYGQHWFNLLHAVRPVLANKIRGTIYDPFHRNIVSEQTIQVVRELWNGNGTEQ